MLVGLSSHPACLSSRRTALGSASFFFMHVVGAFPSCFATIPVILRYLKRKPFSPSRCYSPMIDAHFLLFWATRTFMSLRVHCT